MKEAIQMNEVVVNEHSLAHIKFKAQWQDETGEHTAIHHIEKFNVWRDIDLLPESIINDILNQPLGKGGEHTFSMSELVAEWSSKLIVKVPHKHFTGRLANGQTVKPRVGRYYPKGWFTGVDGVYSENMFPARILEITEDAIVVDYNHPLSARSIKLQIEILDILPPTDEHGGRCADALETLLGSGPGMQAANKMMATEFFVDDAFKRVDEDDDSIFYETLRMVHHLDAHARKIISDIYGELLLPGSKVLDLMSSWESHLPEAVNNIEVTGLGMSAEEMQENSALSDFVVHDLNNNPSLPYMDNQFDLVVCTASIEYLTKPLEVLQDVERTLKPGGRCVITFSNRWFPAKAIQAWSEMHEFERVGLVMEYFRKSGWKGQVNSISNRGLHRPEDDPHYSKIQSSDPVYAVWCEKQL